MNVLEFNTDACVLSNGAYVASFSLLIETGTGQAASVIGEFIVFVSEFA